MTGFIWLNKVAKKEKRTACKNLITAEFIYSQKHVF